MSRPTGNSNSIIRILKKDVGLGLGVNRGEKVEACSFISIDSVDFPPLPKSESIAYKDGQQKESAISSQKLKHQYKTPAKDKNIRPKPKKQGDLSISRPSDCANSQTVAAENHITGSNMQSKSNCHSKEVTEERTDSPSASYEASSVKPLRNTGENTGHINSETVVTLGQQTMKKGQRKKGKKKVKQQVGKIALVTPEMHRILSGERDLSWSGPKCIVDINSTEEYPELDQSKQGTFTSDKKSKDAELDQSKQAQNLPSEQKSKVKSKVRVKHPSVSVISGGVASSNLHDRTSYGWNFTRSFSDLLKATSVPASSSLKFRDERVFQDKTTCGTSQSISSTSPSLAIEEKHRKKNKLIASKQDISFPKAEKETQSPLKTKMTEDGKTPKKFPSTSTPLNMSDFIVGVKSGKIKKSRVKSTGRSLEKKLSTLSPHNMLDSTAPLRKRGKEREVPKKKQLSTLKKIILRERELKKKLLSKELVNLSLPEESIPAENLPLGSVDCQLTDESKNLPDPCVTTNLELKTDSVPAVTNLSEIKTTIVGNNSTVDKSTIIAKQIIHSRNFREYCDQFISGEIDNLLSSLLQELVRFQDRLYEKDPIKAKVKRRLVCGLKEVTKHLKMKKLKVLLVAPDLERINSEGGLDDMLTTLLKLSVDHCIPCVFGLSRRKMGNILRKKVPVSCVGVFNYEGTEETFKPLMETVKEARVIYKDYFQRICDLLKPELIDSIGDSISEEEKRDIWRKITKDPAPDGWAFDSVKKSCTKTEE